MTRVTDLGFAVTGPNAASLPFAVAQIPPPPVTLTALYIPSSWNSAANTWDDMSGNGNSLPAPSSAAAPVRMSEGNVSFLRFDGTKRLNKATFVVPQPFSVYTLMRVTSYPASGRDVAVGLGWSPNKWLASINSAGVVSHNVGGTDRAPLNTTAFDTGTWRTAGMVVAGASSIADVDATEVTGDWSSDTTPTTLLAVGAVNGSATVPGLKADIAGIAIAPSALTSQQRIDLRAYLKARAGL